PHARARIRSIDASRARAQRGVHLVLTAAELGALNQPTPLLIPHPELTHPRTPLPLAVDEVRYAGELVTLIVADDRYRAEDAGRRRGGPPSSPSRGPPWLTSRRAAPARARAFTQTCRRTWRRA